MQVDFGVSISATATVKARAFGFFWIPDFHHGSTDGFRSAAGYKTGRADVCPILAEAYLQEDGR